MDDIKNNEPLNRIDELKEYLQPVINDIKNRIKLIYQNEIEQEKNRVDYERIYAIDRNLNEITDFQVPETVVNDWNKETKNRNLEGLNNQCLWYLRTFDREVKSFFENNKFTFDQTIIEYAKEQKEFYKLQKDLKNDISDVWNYFYDSVINFYNSIPQQKYELTLQQQNFINLFEPPYNTPENIYELKELLKQNNYIDENGTWNTIDNTGKERNLYEIGTLFYVLIDKNIIIVPERKMTPYLRTWCKEFNIHIATGRHEKNVYTTVKNITQNAIWNAKDEYIELCNVWETKIKIPKIIPFVGNK